MPAPAEDELTFSGNARIKALYYSCLASDLIVIADDSGLEVDALNAAPGVRSARYSEDMGYDSPGLSLDDRNNQCLLHALEAVGQPHRTGRYRCVLAAAQNGALLAEGDGTVEGTILNTPQGTSGFGYDPLFYIPRLELTMAEIDAATKLSLSHRGRAFRALISKLENIGLKES
jgi:XTP/dITP diphosphohydrolase